MALPTLREHVPTPEENKNKNKTKTKPDEQSN
jgi:hypothetical protein